MKRARCGTVCASIPSFSVRLYEDVRHALRRPHTPVSLSIGVLSGLVGGTGVQAESAFPPLFELSSLDPANGGDGSEGFILAGIREADSSGYSVSNAGDVNGDGIDDLMIGAREADPSGASSSGQTYVVFGRASGFPAVFELRRLAPVDGGDGSEGFILNGIDPYDRSGRSVSGAGDLNGDGVDDVVIGAFTASPGRYVAGESYVVFGRTTGFPPVLPLRSLHPAAGGNGSAGFILRGIDAYDYSGTSVSGTGDVNGDGIVDLLIGAVGADPGRVDAGESYVVFGRTTGFPPALELRSLHPVAGGDGSEGSILLGAIPGSYSGSSLSGARDLNADGIDDLIIGARKGDAGQSYVVLGRTSGFSAAFDLASLDPAMGGDGSAGFILRGVRPQDYSGASVSDAGDVNGDGIDDVLIGAPHAYAGRFGAGESYVVFGHTAGFPPVFELSSLYPAGGGDGSAGFILRGIGEHDDAGGSVSGAGDVNGDGVDDIVIGARFAGGDDAGQSYVVFGRTTGFPPALELRNLHPAAGGDGSVGFILDGVDLGDSAGVSVSGAGDVNGDGIDDLIIGAIGADPTGTDGGAYVVFGRALVSE